MSQAVHIKNGYNYSGYNFITASTLPIGSMDTTPTQGSSKPVTSNGIYEADNAIDTKIGSLSSLTTTNKTNVVAAINEVRETTMLYKVVFSSISDLSSCRFPASGTNDKIKSTMEVTESVLSNPAAQTGDWTVTFYDGYLTVTGNISGTTNITLKFQDCITLS